MRRLTTLLTATVLGLAVLAGPALAQDYPIEVAPILLERPAPGAVVPPTVDLPGISVAPAVPVAPAQPQLAVTGSDLTVGMALALMLLLSGTAALWVARRRRLATV